MTKMAPVRAFMHLDTTRAPLVLRANPDGSTPPITTPGEVEAGSVVTVTEYGRFDPEWLGCRVYRATPDGLRALHGGYFYGDESAALNAALAEAVAGYAQGVEFPAPREPNGRRRDFTSASQAPRWLTCPGSVRLCDEVAPRQGESSAYADEGTAAHEMAEDCLRFDLDADSMTGVKTEVGVVTTDDMVEHVQLYLDTIREDQRRDGGTITTECSVALPVDVGGVIYTLRGDYDALLWSPDAGVLRVYDLKYGQGVLVDVEDNAQLRIYGLGGVRMIPPSELHKLKRVEMVVVQPRRESSSGELVRRESLSYAELSLWYETVLTPGVAAFDAVNAPLVPSEHGCRWCPVKHVCPALAEKAMETAKHVFSTVRPGDDVETALVKAAAETQHAALTAKAFKADAKDVAATLSPQRLSNILDIAPLVSIWIKAVEERAHELLAQGQDVPGRKLVVKTGNRAWVKDESETVAEIVEATGVSPDVCYAEPKVLSPAQMEKAVAKAAGIKKNEAEKIIATLVHKPETGVTMVPESDSRPPVSGCLEDIFGEAM